MTTKIDAKQLVIGSYAQTSLAGSRSENQDRLTRIPASFGEVILLADGMGGHRSGALAAEVAIRDFPVHLQELEQALPTSEALAESVRRVNRKIYSLGHEGDPALARMGSTIVLAALCLTGAQGELLVANAGDSRAYLWRDGALRLLTRDHTVANRLAEAGLLEAGNVRHHPDSHVLTKALGQSPDLSPDFADPIALRCGDVILLCSDGLSAYVPEDEIGRILSGAKCAEHAVQRLSQAAFERQTRDNVSIQYVRVAEAVSEIRQGAQFGRYRLEAFLGAGGMAQVWLARHENLESPAAIKILDPGFGPAGEMAKRFLTEGRKQKVLQHPAIVRVEGYDETPLPYLVLQYIDGESLHARIKRLAKDRMPIDEFARIAYRVLDALEYAHEHKLVHRDVKSSNILLDSAGEAYLGDFGLVVAEGDPRLTANTSIMGTSEYMSPEHIQKPRQVDRRSDVYSLGCVLYEMLTGETPFAHLADDFAIKLAQVKEKPRDIRKLNPKVSPPVEAVILRSLEKAPADRWQSAAEFHGVLKAAIDDGVFPASSRWTPRRFVAAHRRSMAAIAAVLVLAIIGALLWNIRNESTALRLATIAERLLRTDNRTVASLLALESLRFHPTREAQNVLLQGLSGLGRPAKLLAQGVGNHVYAVAFSPDGSRLAAGPATKDDTVRIWDVRSGQVLFDLVPPFSGNVRDIAWRVDGKMLAVSYTTSAAIWDVESRQVHSMQQVYGNITALAWSLDGASLLGLSNGFAVRLWNAQDGTLLRTLNLEDFGVSMSWAPKSGRLMVGNHAGKIYSWDSHWRPMKEDPSGWGDRDATSTITSIASLPDGSRSALAFADGRVVIPNPGDIEREVTLKCSANSATTVFGAPNPESLHAIAWSPGERLLACADGRNLTVWGTSKSGIRPLWIYEAADVISSIAWSSDGEHIATADVAGNIRLWDPEPGPIVLPLVGYADDVRAIAWKPDFTQITTVEKGARTFDALSGVLLRTFGEPDPSRYLPTKPAILTAGGGFVASECLGDLNVWETSSGHLVRSTQVPVKRRLFAGSPDGREFAWRDGDKFEMRDAADDRLLWSIDTKATALVWSPDGTRVASFNQQGEDRSCDIWEAGNSSRWNPIVSGRGSIRAAAWSHDSRYLAIADTEKTVEIWDSRAGSTVRKLYGHSEWPMSLAWSGDGRLLALGDNQNTVRIWDVTTGEMLHSIDAHGGAITALAWGPGEYLATGSDDGTAKIWMLNPKAIEMVACGYLTRNLTPAEWSEFIPGAAYHRTCPERK